MNHTDKKDFAEVIHHVLQQNQAHFEETAEAYGEESEAATNHVYAKARKLWLDFELDAVSFEGFKPAYVYSVTVAGNHIPGSKLTESEAINLKRELEGRFFDDVEVVRG
jgi:hypothetical protein